MTERSPRGVTPPAIKPSTSAASPKPPAVAPGAASKTVLTSPATAPKAPAIAPIASTPPLAPKIAATSAKPPPIPASHLASSAPTPLAGAIPAVTGIPSVPAASTAASPPVIAAPIITTAPEPPAPGAIPKVTWTSAPPPIPPRSFSTEPPPPESAPPTPIVFPPNDDLNRLRGETLNRAHEIRDEARLLVRQTIDEALAPLHYEMLELKRRIDELEKRPVAAPAPSPSRVAVAPMAAPGSNPRLRAHDPFVPAAAARPMQSSSPGIARVPAPMIVEVDTSAFDGSKRTRRVTVLFVVLLLLLVGGLLAAMISSHVPVSRD